MNSIRDRKTVLIVDDTPSNISIIISVLQAHYRTQMATCGRGALDLVGSGHRPDVILLDLMMPDMDGYEVCATLKADPTMRDVPIIFLTASTDALDEIRCFEMGAVDYISKPICPATLLARVKSQLTLTEARRVLLRQNLFLEERDLERTRELWMLQEATIIALASLAETRDNETGNHIRRTQRYVKTLAEELQKQPRFAEQLTDRWTQSLYQSSALHDIGKVGIPDRILLKPGKLTAGEFDIMKTHVHLGRDAIASAEKHLGRESSFLGMASQIAYSHHEKWDGSGYPEGLVGEAIPLSARLMAVADVYDALISKRVYKPAFSHEKAVGIVREGRESHFDPAIVDAFELLSERFRGLAQEWPDSDEEVTRKARLGDFNLADVDASAADSCRC